MDWQISIRLKILNSLLARAQGRDFIFDGRNFLNLPFKNLNFLLQKTILGLLIGDHHLKPPINGTSYHQTKEERRKHRSLKGLFAALPRLLSVGE